MITSNELSKLNSGDTVYYVTRPFRAYHYSIYQLNFLCIDDDDICFNNLAHALEVDDDNLFINLNNAKEMAIGFNDLLISRSEEANRKISRM